MSESSKKCIVTLGEIMLRLKSPGFERFLQSPQFEATWGGGEANVAESLAMFGMNVRYVTALPQNPLADSCISFLRSFNIDTSYIVRQGDRVGIYFLEAGSGPRGSQVIYDRTNSTISQINSDAFSWSKIFNDAQWFHITGITPAISQKAADLALFSLKAAKTAGLTTSCDLNYRKNLWKYGKNAPEVMNTLIPYVDIIIANEEDIQKSLDIKIEQQIGGAELDRVKYENMGKMVLEKFPNVKIVAITLRESFSADHNDWAAICIVRGEKNAFISKKYSIKNIVDRVGGGDAFGAGLIYGLIQKMSYQDALEFAVAASALKHTILGDSNRATLSEVKSLLAGDASGRVKR
jgi:2-dehydro-3-deoxygluconokinase